MPIDTPDQDPHVELSGTTIAEPNEGDPIALRHLYMNVLMCRTTYNSSTNELE